MDEKTEHDALHKETVFVDLSSEQEAAHRGALLEEEERNLGYISNVKLHWRPLLCCSVAFTSAMMFGYDSIANGASLAMPSFFIYFGDIGPTGPYLPSLWTSLWSALSQLAQAIGAFLVGFLMDRFGRKYVGCSASGLTLVGTAVQFVAQTRSVLLGGKIIAGFGVGAAMAAGTTYASEVAPLKLRAPVQQGIILFTVFMFGLALGIVRIFVPDIHPSAFRTVFAIQWAVGGVATIVWLLIPESPNFLVTKERIDSAEKAMGRIYGNNRSVDDRLARLIKTIREEEAHKHLNSGSYIECFRSNDLKRTLTAMFIYTTINWGGAAFLTQNILILIIAGLQPVHAFDIGIGGFGLSLLIIIGSWSVMGYFRRHNAFLFGCILNCILMTIIGALYYAPGKSGLWASAILMNLAIVFQTSLIQAMGYPIAAEVSTYRLRGKTISLATISQAVMSWITSFVVPYMYNVDEGNLGIKTGFIWAGFSVLLIIGAWFLIPDTTNLTAEEIDKLYTNKTKPRDFQKALDRGEVETEIRRDSVQA